ncbi:MAG: TIR domain-containing protein [Capsulimonadaceae bacterium]
MRHFRGYGPNSARSDDKPAVRGLVERLRGDGLRVWFDEDCIAVGESIPIAIENGLVTSPKVTICWRRR